jgi:hypothetical protein
MDAISRIVKFQRVVGCDYPASVPVIPVIIHQGQSDRNPCVLVPRHPHPYPFVSQKNLVCLTLRIYVQSVDTYRTCLVRTSTGTMKKMLRRCCSFRKLRVPMLAEEIVKTLRRMCTTPL